jgi:hypothetical protein
LAQISKKGAKSLSCASSGFFLGLLSQSEKNSEIKQPLVHSCMKRKERKNRREIYWYLKCLQTLEIERLASLPL